MNSIHRYIAVQRDNFKIQHSAGHLTIRYSDLTKESVKRLPEDQVLDHFIKFNAKHNGIGGAVSLFHDPMLLWNVIHVYGSIEEAAIEMKQRSFYWRLHSALKSFIQYFI